MAHFEIFLTSIMIKIVSIMENNMQKIIRYMAVLTFIIWENILEPSILIFYYYEILFSKVF